MIFYGHKSREKEEIKRSDIKYSGYKTAPKAQWSKEQEERYRLKKIQEIARQIEVEKFEVTIKSPTDSDGQATGRVTLEYAKFDFGASIASTRPRLPIGRRRNRCTSRGRMRSPKCSPASPAS